MKLIGLVDCDNFYASCERVFRPDLRKVPIVVLSNNDGCVIARSKEAKNMGIKMGVPWFQVKQSYLAKGGKVFSSNFALYGDLSKRIMHILGSMVKNIEIYSIDEAFLDLQHIQKTHQAHEFAIHCRKTIHQWVGIPVRIGIAPTKTLAKIASHIAKRETKTGVVCLNKQDIILNTLKNIPVNEVWGIGRQLSNHLNKAKIVSAYDLATVNMRFIRKRFSIVLERTVRELKGEQCLEIQGFSNPKKQIIVSRSFRSRIDNLEVLKPLISNFAVRAGEKLRHEGQKCSQVSVFFSTSPFNKKLKHRGIYNMNFSNPTNDTRDILTGVKTILKKNFKPGYPYAKAGVLLSRFSSESIAQISLFEETNTLKQNHALMKYIDSINQYQTQVYFTAQHHSSLSPMKLSMKSPRYTTNWYELPSVN